MKNNLAYLESLVAGLRDIPRKIAERVAEDTYFSLSSDTALDSGQAALSWHVAPYFGTPRYERFEILWGTPASPPKGGAGYKSMYSSLGPTGDWSTVTGVLSQRARSAFDSSGRISGYVVYNTVTENSLSSPEESKKYFDNALRIAESNLPKYLEQALSKAYSEITL